MRTATRLCLICSLLFISANRLPAPIQEENPTPAPAQSIRPKPKRTIRPKVSNENAEGTATSQKRASAPASTPIQNRFDGTWVGTLNNLPFVGNVEYTLLVSGGGASVVEKSANFGTNNFQANSDGYTMRWETGASWTLTPNSDGQTALITCNSGGFFGAGAFSLSTVFRRTSTSATQASAPVITNTSGSAPVAKPVPDRPGFVYNPFDPNSHILLDVRGKPSGTKLIEPKSGRLFVVP